MIPVGPHRAPRCLMLRSSWYRPYLERLEDRLPPGAALDWLLFPQLAPSVLGSSLADSTTFSSPLAARPGSLAPLAQSRVFFTEPQESGTEVQAAPGVIAPVSGPFTLASAPAPWATVDFGPSFDPLTSAANGLPLVPADHEAAVANPAAPTNATAAPTRTVEEAQPRFPFHGAGDVALPSVVSLLPPGVNPPPGVMSGPGGDQVLVAPDAAWRYLDDGSDQGTTWRALSFDDSGWASGPAELGYGDGDEATQVGYGLDPNNKYITTYFRNTFDVANPGDFQSLQLWLLRDDGAVVYLNGTEIYRSNMPTGTVAYRTPASEAIGGADESAGYHTALPATGLRAGANVLAVEIHQANPTSSDISFASLLIGSVAVRFAVIGDFGSAGTPELDVANMVKSWYPDFVVTTGDNNYPNGEANTIVANIGQYYCPFIGNPDAPANQRCNSGLSTNRFYPSAGNHDWDSPDGTLAPYRNYFTLPTGSGNERYYEAGWGPVRLFAVDSDSREPSGITSGSVQGTWLRTRLAAATEPWKLVHLHHPPYSSGTAHGSTPDLQWPYQAWGASAVVAGHEHIYERILRNDFPYFVNGLGGYPSLHEIGTPIQGSQARYNSNWGAQYVEATSWYIVFLFISVDGSYYDFQFLF